MTTPRVTVPVELAERIKSFLLQAREDRKNSGKTKQALEINTMLHGLITAPAAPAPEGGAVGVASAGGVHFAVVDHRVVGEAHDTYAEAEAAALASGSDDHAELVRLGDRNVELSVLAYKWMEAHDALKSGQPYDYPSPADVPALVAEVAALRAERDQIRSLYNRATDRSRHWEIASISSENRATEAKRKLAEAVGLLTRWLNTRGEMSGAGTVETAISTFLSKEAERG